MQYNKNTTRTQAITTKSTKIYVTMPCYMDGKWLVQIVQDEPETS